jgi:Gas vesicle protein
MEGSYLPSGRSAGLPGRPTESTNLADILERVLDKGIVIAGDIQINLLDIELLTIKLRLLIASVDRAREMGINWWETDPSLQAMEGDNGDREELEQENRELRQRLERLEERMGLQQGGEEQGREEQGREGQRREEHGREEPSRAG